MIGSSVFTSSSETGESLETSRNCWRNMSHISRRENIARAKRRNSFARVDVSVFRFSFFFIVQ